MTPTIPYARHWSSRKRHAQDARYAALLDALTTLDGAGAYNRMLVRGAVNHGLIVSETDRTITPFGRAWRTAYTGTPAPLARIVVTSRNAADHGRQQAAQQIASALIDAGLILVHPSLVDALSSDELTLWLKAKRHERDGLTLAELARLLGEPVEATRIRAERIVEKGYTVAVRDEGQEAA